jgi:hypothetical protein
MEQFTDEHQKAINLKSTYIGQIPAIDNPFTYLIREGPLSGTVIKGPYSPNEKIYRLINKIKGLQIMKCRIPETKILKDEHRFWLEMKAFATTSPNEWTCKKLLDKKKYFNVVNRNSLGTDLLSNKSLEKIQKIIFDDYFLFGDFLIASIFECDDLGPMNTLVSDNDAILIDFDKDTNYEIKYPSDIFRKYLPSRFKFNYTLNKEKILLIFENLEKNKEELLKIGIWNEKRICNFKKVFSLHLK